MTSRIIAACSTSRPTIEGAGVHLKRAFGFAEIPRFDPFLMLDDFHTSNPAEYLPGFPWHPHRGIETITYLLEGVVEHGDSMGNRGTIGAGDVQWMTAGSGIIHQEMPQPSPTGTMWGFQFWANLPAQHKMMTPRYRDIKAADIPEVLVEGGVRIKVVAGNVAGVCGPVQGIVIEPEMLDVSVPAGTIFRHPLPPGHTAFAYVLEGTGYFDAPSDGDANLLCRTETVVLYAHEGEGIQVSTHKDPVRFLLVAGRPLNEPIAWSGPIVMNTQEELRQAFLEYRNGTFLDHHTSS